MVSIPFDYVLSLFFLLSILFSTRFAFFNSCYFASIYCLDGRLISTQYSVSREGSYLCIKNSFEFNGVISLKTPKTKQK